jgi:hypothetical protein
MTDQTTQGEEEVLKVYKCSKELVGRVKAKAALKGKDQSDWVRQVLERETAKLKPVQEDYKKEKD